MSHRLKVLLLAKVTPTVENYVRRLEDANDNLEITVASYADLEVYISEDKINIYCLGQLIDDFDMVYFKTTFGHTEMAAAVANYLKQRKVKFIDQATANEQITSKVYQYVILRDNGIRVASSIFVLKDAFTKSYDLFKKNLGLPFVLKDIHGRKGRLNYKVSSRQEFNKILKDNEGLGIKLIAQRYIENEGDYRILVFGDEIYLVIKRRRADNSTHLNNLAMGGTFSQVPISNLPPAVQHQAIHAAEVLGRQLAGVDFVQDVSNGKWYCVEVNEGPQLSTGVLIKEKSQAVAAFIEKYISK